MMEFTFHAGKKNPPLKFHFFVRNILEKYLKWAVLYFFKHRTKLTKLKDSQICSVLPWQPRATTCILSQPFLFMWKLSICLSLPQRISSQMSVTCGGQCRRHVLNEGSMFVLWYIMLSWWNACAFFSLRLQFSRCFSETCIQLHILFLVPLHRVRDRYP